MLPHTHVYPGFLNQPATLASVANRTGQLTDCLKSRWLVTSGAAEQTSPDELRSSQKNVSEFLLPHDEIFFPSVVSQ